MLTPGVSRSPRPRLHQLALAWLVHAYTALGLVAAALIAVLIVRGGDDAFRLGFALMALATFVDTTDGWLARLARVDEVLPRFDGRKLDDLSDFLTYTCLPLLLIWRADLLPASHQAWLVAPLVASAYGFSQTHAKTDDHFFVGFPSHWNVLAFYLYLLRLPGEWALGAVLFFALLTFVPARYLYTTHGGPLSLTTNLLGSAWAVALAAILWQWRTTPRWLLLASLTFPAYYLAVSWVISVRRRFWTGSSRS